MSTFHSIPSYIYLSTIFHITHSTNVVCMPTLVHLQFLIEAEQGTKETGLHSVLTVTGVGMMKEKGASITYLQLVGRVLFSVLFPPSLTCWPRSKDIEFSVVAWVQANFSSLNFSFLSSEGTGLDSQSVTVGQKTALQALTWLRLAPVIPCFPTFTCSHTAKGSSHVNDFQHPQNLYPPVGTCFLFTDSLGVRMPELETRPQIIKVQYNAL